MASKLIENLTCHICKHIYTDPTILQCMHTFCKQCVSSLVISDLPTETLLDVDSIDSDNECEQEKPHIKCPTCNSISVLDDKGIEDLPENKTYASIVKRYKENIKHNEKPVTCDLCDESEVKTALKSCVQCRMSYCTECLDQCNPDRGKLSSHKLCEPIKEFQDYHDDSLEENVLLHDKLSDKFPVGYCIDCCVTFKTMKPERERHADHMYLDLKVAKPQIIANLEVEASKLEFFRNQYHKIIHEAELEIENLQMEEKRRVSEMNKSISDLHSHLDEKEHSLIGQIKSEIISKVGDQTRIMEDARKMACETMHEAQEIRELVEKDFVDISVEELTAVESRVGKLRPLPEEMIVKKTELSRYMLDIQLVTNAISSLGLNLSDRKTRYTYQESRQQGFQMMPPQMTQSRPFYHGNIQPAFMTMPGLYSQGAVRATMNVRPITGQSGGAARPGVYQDIPLNISGRPPQTAKRPPKQQLRPANQQAVTLVKDREPLTASMMAAAQPQEQKQMLGERLFPLIQPMYPDLAGKITGMLLETDNSELLHMLESNESLETKVKEAVAVLQAHQAKEAASKKPSK